jgi:myo-inositol-1(or 4)-monophosphatase
MAAMSAAIDRAGTLGADWLGACRAAAEALRDILVQAPTTAERIRETGTTGDGGDQTLIIDADAEAAVFAELERLHGEGARFTAISEERGMVDFGDPGVIVIIDPIDGSMNAKRGLPHHSISIAVADGPTMADVVFGYVYDYGPDEEWTARRGEGAFLDGVPLLTDVPERCSADGKLELLGIESADPRWIREAADDLAAAAHRVRALGTIAVTLCQVAGSRLDGMCTLKGCRAVDAAAGQLIVREAGGQVVFPGFEDPLGAPLDTEPHSAIIAARTLRGIETLRPVPKK